MYFSLNRGTIALRSVRWLMRVKAEVLHSNIRNWSRLNVPWAVISYGKQGGMFFFVREFLSNHRGRFSSVISRVSGRSNLPASKGEKQNWCKETVSTCITHSADYRSLFVNNADQSCFRTILLLLLLHSPCETQRAIINYNYYKTTDVGAAILGTVIIVFSNRVN